jgi:MOSC domain-containing protein YiiM
MVETLRELGRVKLTQVQPSGLIIYTSSSSTYDPSRRVEVSRLLITPQGIEATTADGERVLDIHHTAHPQTRYLGDDDVLIGFTSHYAAMRARFGEHMLDGIAGENIIIEYEHEVWLEDLGQQIAIENPETGHKVLLDVKDYATPCEQFSHFAARSQHERLAADKLKATLQFLENGRRGFLLVLSDGQPPAEVQPGDRVLVAGAG